MKAYFDTKAVYVPFATDNNKPVTERYIVLCETLQEAERATLKEIDAKADGIYPKSVACIAKSDIDLVIDNNDLGCRYYKVKSNFITVDEKSGKEKNQASYAIVYNSSVTGAEEAVVQAYKGIPTFNHVISVSETNVSAVLQYTGQDSEDEQP